MTGEHAELVAELRALAETVLERIEPILQKAAAGAEEFEGQERCSSCSWCPLCALAALIRGEQHDLVTALAGHASTVLAVLREVLDGHRHPDTGHAADAPAGAEPGAAFVPIDVTIRE